MKLGISVYPEQKTIQEIESYLALASKYGFTKVFTSMFSIPKSAEEIEKEFTVFCQKAHQYGMEVSTDVNPQCFDKMKATPSDLSVFKRMGIDSIRMDACFNDERDLMLINNPQGIHIKYSAMMIPVIDKLLEKGADPSKITVCHNFYPQRYTGADVNFVTQINEHWKAKKVAVGLFITSQKKDTHGPWPVSDGLCTIEEHRNLPVDVQLRHLLAMDNADEILFGNAFVSEEEFKVIKSIMDLMNENEKTDVDEITRQILEFILSDQKMKKHLLKLDLDPSVTQHEKEIVFHFPCHFDMGDGTSYMLRSRLPRIVYKDNIPLRECGKTKFTRGDVVIVNDHCAHYRGEVQIVLKDMEVDGQRNLIGHIKEEELFLIDYIKPKELFKFIEER